MGSHTPQLINLFILCLFVALQLTSVEPQRFTSQPPTTVTGIKGYGLWLTWDYTLDGGSLVLLSCGKLTAGKVVSYAEATSGDPQLKVLDAWKHRVLSYPGVNRTFAIWNLSYSDAGAYMCELSYRKDGLKELKSSITNAIIEGRPEFCKQAPATQISKKEGETAIIETTLCGIPAPDLVYRWLPSQETTTLASTPVSGSSTEHNATIRLISINKDKCGKTIAFKGKNRRGETAEKNVKVDVKFKPVPPPGVRAYYTSNGDCVKCEWNKQESGLCKINYAVHFLDKSGLNVQSKTGQNIITAELCGLGKNSTNVTSVNVTASTSEGTAFKVFTVSAVPPTNGPGGKGGGGSSDSSVYVIVGCVIGGIILIALIVLGVIYCKRKSSQRVAERKNGNRGNADIPRGTIDRPSKSEYASVDVNPYKTDEQLYAQSREKVVYGELGNGGGRVGPRPSKPAESNYADIKLDGLGYPAVGPTTTSNYAQAMISDEAIV